MNKIAINICHGGFNLSHKALLKYAELKGISVTTLTVDKSQEDDDHPFGKWKRVRPGEENDRYGIFHLYLFRDIPESWKDYDETEDFKCLTSDDIERDDPALIETLETIGLLDCNGALSNINIVEIPDDVIWEIEEYDGNEWVSEVHRRWS